MAEQYVLDASALLASLFGETGSEWVGRWLDRSVMSAVNYAEVISRQIKLGEQRAAAIQSVDDLSLPIIAWDHDLARQASELAPLGWTHGLSFGDRACLTTARHLRLTVLTADRGWLNLPNLDIAIEVIR